MRFRTVLLMIGFVVVTAVSRALAGLVLGDSPSRAAASGVLFAVWFVPGFLLLMWVLDRRGRRRLGLSGSSSLTPANVPICVRATATAMGSVGDVASAVEHKVIALKGRVQRNAGAEGEIHLSASLGSRLALRLIGFYPAPGRRRLPMKLHVELRRSDIDGVVGNIEACSDEGWYLLRSSTFEAQYRRALDGLASQVREAFTDYTTARR